MPSRKRKEQLAAARSQRYSVRDLPTEDDQLAAAPVTVTPTHSSSFLSDSALHNVIATPVSASKRKLDYFSNITFTPLASSQSNTAIVYLDMFQHLFASLLCPVCFNDQLKFSVDEKSSCGLVKKVAVICSHCDQIVSSTFSSPKLEDTSFEVNHRVVASSLASGIGFETMNKFFEFLDIASFHHKTYSSHVSKIHSKLPAFKNRILSLSCEKIRSAYGDSGSDVLDIDVSYDGTWQTRGHKSQSGVSCVIESKTGLVADFHVMTRFCQVCATTGEQVKAHSSVDEYNSWMDGHKLVCKKNHFGSSGSMEQQGAIAMWNRSVCRNNMRYISMISDGDTNTIKELHKAQPYGEDCTVQKLECINHVSKRMGKALRTLVDTRRKQKITLGGNGLGKLTEKKMIKLQKYYRKAILSSDSVVSMKRAIWATFYHSTDSDPLHSDCPVGEHSFCYFQRAIAKGTPKPQPKMSDTFLNPFVAGHVKDVFEKLTDDDLLKRCLLGKTQNVNESIHSLIWSRCPKHLFVQKPRIDIAVSVGVAEFNMGSKGSQIFLEELGFAVGAKTLEKGNRRDVVRVRKAERAVSVDCKRRRKIVNNAIQAENQRLERLEGGPQYVAGGF